MKGIGWCLEHIQKAIRNLPLDVNCERNIEKAHKLTNRVQEYMHTLIEIVKNPKFKKNLYKLENCQIKEIKLEAEKIEKLFRDLQAICETDEYFDKLRHMIENNPEEWRRIRSDLSQDIDIKFGGERGDLKEAFLAVIHDEEELKEIISNEDHLIKLLKW